MGEHKNRARQRAGTRCEGKAIAGYSRIALVGFMGAGKTTVGRLVAPMLGWRFLDTDEMLVERHGASIAAIFEEHGEPKFREWEAAVVASALREEQVVIALGGGAVEHAGTREILAGNSQILTVFLKASLAVALARCATEPGAAARPVLADAARLHIRHQARLPMYRLARLILDTKSQTPELLARAIADAAEFPRSSYLSGSTLPGVV